MTGPEDNPADEHRPTKEEWERIMGKDNQAPARPSEGEDVELCVLIDGEEKPISHAVAFELAKIEAHTYMEFYGDRREAKSAATVCSLKLIRDGFPPWFAEAYRVSCHKYIDHITVI